MDLLSEHQVDYISDVLIENGVTYDELRADLLDHMCCIVEESVDQGNSFHQGLEKALEMFGLEELRILQETTLYLINSKLNIMKKTVGITGIITASLIVLGVLFRLNHIAGAGIFLVLGLSGTALLVFPLYGYISLRSPENRTQKIAAIIGYGAGLMICMGVLFKMMHWPGANVLSLTGLAVLGIGFMPFYTVNSYKMAENKLYALSRAMLIAAGLVIFWTMGTYKYRISPEKRVQAEQTTPSK